MVKINGKPEDIAGKKLSEYLIENGYNLKRIAVEICGDIVPKTMYAETIIKDGDIIEVVSFVGGG